MAELLPSAFAPGGVQNIHLALSKTPSGKATVEIGTQCQLPWDTHATSAESSFFGNVRAHDVERSLGPSTMSAFVRDAAVQAMVPWSWHACSASSSSRSSDSLTVLREAVQVVIEGFPADRPPKHVNLLAVEAFAMGPEEMRAAAAAVGPQAPAAPAASSMKTRDALLPPPPPPPPPSHQRLERVLTSMRRRQPNAIDLSEYSGLADLGAKRLCDACFGHPTLTELRLPKTTLGASGTSFVAELITVHLRLKLVELSHNAVQDVGAGFLSQALKASRSLQTLELQACQIGNPGGCSLANAIVTRSTSGLTSLDLAFNPLGAAGVEALREACTRSRTLKRLSLAGARADPSLLAAVATALTPAGKAAPSGSRLFEQGFHTEETHKAMLAEQAATAAPAGDTSTLVTASS